MASNGTVVWSGAYDAFGNCEVGVETVESHLRLPGQYYDEETGLYYNLNRYYDPKIGRYLQPDPAGDGLNPYTYVGGNPVNAIDPLGLCAVKQIVAGDFTESVNLLGTAVSIGLGFTGIDIIGDVRDFVANVYHRRIGWALVNLASVLPVVGVLKYGDEVAELTDAAHDVRKTAQAEIESLPEFAKITREEIVEALTSRGYRVTHATGSGVGEPGYVWTKAIPDGRTAVVRIDPTGQRIQFNGKPVPRDWAAYNPHAHKETVLSSRITNGNFDPFDDSVMKFTDVGRIARKEDFANLDKFSVAIHIPVY